MRLSTRTANFLGIVALGMTPVLARAEDPPVPPVPGIPGPFRQPAIPDPGGPVGYGPQPLNPNPDGYGQSVNLGVGSPGGYPTQPVTPYPYPGGLNDYPIRPSIPYGGGTLAPAPGPPPMVALADQLIAQANAFLRAFAPNARIVPEGRWFIADTIALRDAAIRFRQAAANGAPPNVVAAEFQKVQAGWRRLDSRMYRVSRGRLGPNIATALQMGRTIEQIRSLP